MNTENLAGSEARRWRQVEEIWAEAARIPGPEREAWLRRACGGNAEIEAEVRALLQAGDEVGDRFERLIGDAVDQFDEDLPPTEVESSTTSTDSTGASDLTGMRFGYVRIQSRLGQGGMGRVYRGVDERLGRPVALKVLRPELASQSTMVRRLKREAQLLSQLQHPAICQLYDVLQVQGTLGLVLELVEGERLSTVIAKGVDRDQAMEWTAVLAEVLAAAHGAGIVHRDLKPGNVMVTPEGGLKVLDFGIARHWSADDSTSDPRTVARRALEAPGFTAPGEILGTLLYMSPEQARGDSISPATDLFSLGLILHELLSGQAAYAPSRHGSELPRVILNGEVPSLTDLPADLENLRQRLTAPAPGARPSARDAAERLRQIQSSPRRRRRKILRRTSVAVVVSLALAAAWQGQRAAEEAVRADEAARAAERMAEFVSTMFQSTSPWRLDAAAPMDPTIPSTDQVFLRGLAQLEEGLEDEPALHARLLLSASEVALDLDLIEWALRTSRKSLELRRGLFGNEHPSVAQSLIRVAHGLYFAGHLEEGLQAVREARDLLREFHPEPTADLCESLLIICQIANEYGDLEEAETAAREALRECPSVWPSDSIDWSEAQIFAGLALFARAQRDGVVDGLDEGLGFIRLALQIQADHLGDGHPTTALSRSILARALLERGDVEDAGIHLQQATDQLAAALGETARETELARSYLAEARRQGGDLEEALEIHQGIVQRLEVDLGPDHLDLLAPLRALSRALLDLERFEEAENRLRWALALALNAFPPGHWESRELQVLLSQALVAQGEFEEARSTLLEASQPGPHAEGWAARWAHSELESWPPSGGRS